MDLIVQTILQKMGIVDKPSWTALTADGTLHHDSDSLWEGQLYESESI